MNAIFLTQNNMKKNAKKTRKKELGQKKHGKEVGRKAYSGGKENGN